MKGGAADLDPRAIERELARLGSALGRPCSIVSSTSSTNDDARMAARAGAPHGAIFIADAQTNGRGRAGHAWHSPPGESIYLSLLLRPDWPAARSSAATLAVGVAVARVVDEARPESAPRARIKWPNDVEVEGRKIAGVLAEAQLRGGEVASLVVGVGLNVSADQFPDAIASRATSLCLVGATVVDRSVLVGRIVAEIERALAGFAAEGLSPLLDELRGRDALRGRRVTVGDVSGVASGIDAEGRLVLVRDDGTETFVVAGEASIQDAFMRSR